MKYRKEKGKIPEEGIGEDEIQPLYDNQLSNNEYINWLEEQITEDDNLLKQQTMKFLDHFPPGYVIKVVKSPAAAAGEGLLYVNSKDLKE
jgi:hypothetical protein